MPPPDNAVEAVGRAAAHAAAAPSAPEDHWYNVWTETGSGLMQPPSPSILDAPMDGVIDERVRMAQKAAAHAERTDWSEMKAGMAQQGSAVLNQALALIHCSDDPKAAPEGVLGHAGAALGLLPALEQLVTMPLGAIPFPAFPALRITDQCFGLPHAHNHPPNVIGPGPPIPLPSIGPVIPIPFVSGASKVLINGLPGARCGDIGIGIWCGGYFPLYEVFLGSSNVWVEGNRAGRLGVDITKHCIFTTPKPSDPPIGPMFGFPVTGSPNVIIGGVPLPSLTSMAMGAAFKALFKRLWGLLGKLRKAFGKGRVPPAPHTSGSATGHMPPPHRSVPAIHSPRVAVWARTLGEGDRIIIKEINAGELRALTEVTGREWAVVVNNEGKLALVQGIHGTVPLEAGDHLLVHTHPPGADAFPSSPGNTGTPGAHGSDVENAAFNRQHYGWDHPQAVVGQNGDVRYFDHNGVINNPNTALVPIGPDGTVNGLHQPGGGGGNQFAIPPAMRNPGTSPYRNP